VAGSTRLQYRGTRYHKQYILKEYVQIQSENYKHPYLIWHHSLEHDTQVNSAGVWLSLLCSGLLRCTASNTLRSYFREVGEPLKFADPPKLLTSPKQLLGL
jgi:hypothetical protein